MKTVPVVAPPLLLIALLAGCMAGPDYRKPPVDMPVAWKIEAPWRVGTPDDLAAKGAWWTRYNEPALDALEQQALSANLTLATASARLAQARATVASTSAALFPQVNLGARAARQKTSADRPLSNYASPNFSTVQSDLVGSFSVNYEIDLAGRVRRTIEGARASAEQSAADFENTRLLVTAELATDYFSLRELDTEQDVVARSIALQRRALEFATSRHDLGATSGLDVAQQQALLDSTLTQVDVLQKQRDQFEHAIATLMGAPAPAFALAPKVDERLPPAIPVGVPSDMLERRPDVAAAERAMAAANAQIGIARAAFYPSIMLAPSYGVESTSLATLFNAPSLLWSLGVSLTQPIFDAGRLQANVDFARAGYDVTVANYRRVVLIAMQEAEDGITGLAALDRATAQSGRAIESSRRVLDLATSRYEGGVATYLDVITAQQALLANERLAAQLAGQRLVTSVFLVKALGGGWDADGRLASRQAH
ncbi:MAG: efflux transporter outer membrane subunit [Casimicrobiaceae bacterium]